MKTIKNKVLFIGIDGLRVDCLDFPNSSSVTPHLHALAHSESGAFSYDCLVGDICWSAANWSSMLRGYASVFLVWNKGY